MNDYQEERIISTRNFDAENDYEYSLRPRTIDEYVGQKKVKENLEVFIQAARERREALDHVLLYGPPGLGKTTLASRSGHAACGRSPGHRRSGGRRPDTEPSRRGRSPRHGSAP